jgi:hypothetical protein
MNSKIKNRFVSNAKILALFAVFITSSIEAAAQNAGIGRGRVVNESGAVKVD